LVGIHHSLFFGGKACVAIDASADMGVKTPIGLSGNESIEIFPAFETYNSFQ
jgi:hypothetical protein